MIKIITYVYTDKKGFSRRADGKADVAEKKNGGSLISEGERISAEQELDEFIRSGWQIVSTSTYIDHINMMGNTISTTTRLTIILYRPY